MTARRAILAAMTAAATAGAADAAEFSQPYLDLEQLEIQRGEDREAAHWDFVAGLETDVVAFTLQSEGDVETQTGRIDEGEAQVRVSRPFGDDVFGFVGGRFAKFDGRNVVQGVAGIGGAVDVFVYDLSARLFEAPSFAAELSAAYTVSDDLLLQPYFEIEVPFTDDGVHDRDAFEPEFEVALGFVYSSEVGAFEPRIAYALDGEEQTVTLTAGYYGWLVDDVEILPSFELELTEPRDARGDEATRFYELGLRVGVGLPDYQVQPYVGLIYQLDERSAANRARTGLDDAERLLFLLGARAEY